MKRKSFIMKSILSALALMTICLAAFPADHWVVLPDIACAPPLMSYMAEADHYSGPACIQAILNAVPSVADRQLNDQDDIYASILANNTEPATWFSDPDGIDGALDDPVLTSVGNWHDYSSTDKSLVMGKIMYWMNSQRYMTPVSIGAGPLEYWVLVYAFCSSAVPDYAGTVTLNEIYFHDPMPGNTSTGYATGGVWMSNPQYWGMPLNKPGSSWDNKYIAVIEPPKVRLYTRYKKWVIEGKILPPDIIKKYYYQWQKELKYNDRMPKEIRILFENPPIKDPILVGTERYSYYLIPYKEGNLFAIFNAYTGEFEEFRCFEKSQELNLNRDTVIKQLDTQLRELDLTIDRVNELELSYDPYLASASRFAPAWEAQIVTKANCCTTYNLNLTLDATGDIVKGLGDLELRK